MKDGAHNGDYDSHFNNRGYLILGMASRKEK